MKRHRKKIFFALLAGVIFIAFILPKVPLFQTEAGGQSGEQRRQTATPVKAAVLQPETLRNHVETTGTAMANERVELRSEISGKITAIHFAEGTRVSQGDLLVKINDAELQAQLLKLEQQKKLAEDREFRQRRLLEKQAISQETYDQTLNQLRNLEAEIQLTEARIEKTEIRAPFDGVIGLRQISPGDYISPSVTIATLQDIQPIKIEFSIPEKYAGRVTTGSTIHFAPTNSDTMLRGQVYAIEPRIDPETRTLQMRAKAGNRSGAILPGSFVQVDLVLEEVPNALLIPTEALIPEFQGQKVYLIQNGKATPREVRTGIRTNERIQVIEGLAPQDTVITAGLLQLRPGSPIEIQELAE